MKRSLALLASLMAVFIAGCDGTPPPAPPLPSDGSGNKLGDERNMSTAPRRVTIVPSRTAR